MIEVLFEVWKIGLRGYFGGRETVRRRGRVAPALLMGCLAMLTVVPAAAEVSSVRADEPGNSVVVVYNSKLPESKQIAEHYAEQRNVPSDQVFGFALPVDETMTRKQYRDQLEKPLLKRLESGGLMQFASARSRRGESEQPPLPVNASIRYVVLCYGVPLKIAADPRLKEDDFKTLRPELQRNEAAVDSELALLPLDRFKRPLYGLVANRAYTATNAALLHPTNGILMVARLDGPSAAVARGLVDKALEAERNGLWGRAYFDARGLTNGGLKIGDDWIQGSAAIVRRLGFETTVDDQDERFGATYPMSHIALYAGWYEYDGQVSGPFTQPAVEFVPGAFAYHIHSFGAATLKSATQNWVGPLLAKGVTATMGSVYEPYLEFTPHLPTFMHRWIHQGFSFGEAAYAAQPFLSWQITVVGDPLYRPFERKPREQHDWLIRNNNRQVEWSHLKVVNINLETGLSPEDLIGYIEKLPELSESAVLLEKLATLYFAKSNYDQSIAMYQKALSKADSRQQRIRLSLRLAKMLELANRQEEAQQAYQRFAVEFPDYPLN